MKLDESFLYNPKCFDMLVSSTGLLSGNQRKERIITIAKKNIWLAAKCKNTCVNEEDDVVEWIILRANVLYSKFKDVHAIAALMELGEYGALCVMLGLMTSNNKYNNIPKDIYSLILRNEKSISKAYAVISEHLDKNIATSIFNCLKDLGYVLETEAYNSLLARADNNSEIEILLNQMKQSGVESDAITYFQLIRKASSYEEALINFENFKSLATYYKDNDLYIKSIKLLFRKARNLEDVKHIISLYKNDDFDSIIIKQVATFFYNYYCIKLSNSYNDTKYYLDIYFNSLNPIHKYHGKDKTEIKKSIKAIVVVFVERILSEKLQFDEALDALTYISNICTKYKLTQSLRNDIVEKTSLLIVDIIKNLGDFQKGIKLIRVMYEGGLFLEYSCYDELLLYVQNMDDIDFIFSYKEPSFFRPKSIVFAIMTCNAKIAEYIFYAFKNNHYPLNVIHYNAIIKRISLEKSFQLVHDMKMNGIVPDKYTIQPMLRKWKSIPELKRVIQLASSMSIIADEHSVSAIELQVSSTRLYAEFIDFSNEESLKDNEYLDETWKKALMTVCNYIK